MTFLFSTVFSRYFREKYHRGSETADDEIKFPARNERFPQPRTTYLRKLLEQIFNPAAIENSSYISKNTEKHVTMFPRTFDNSLIISFEEIELFCNDDERYFLMGQRGSINFERASRHRENASTAKVEN